MESIQTDDSLEMQMKEHYPDPEFVNAEKKPQFNHSIFSD